MMPPLYNLNGLRGLGSCIPCMQARGPSGLGAPLAPESQRDLVSGAIAFTLPLAYHVGAPKKWPRGGVVVNVGAVVGLYFLTRWTWDRLAPQPSV